MWIEPERFEEALLGLGEERGFVVGLAEQELRAHRARRLEHRLEDIFRSLQVVDLEIGETQQKENSFVARGGRTQRLEVADGRRQLAHISAAHCKQLPGL